jgi:hypothetical protein
MATYSLGSFTFINLEGIDTPRGAPETVRQASAIIQRPGVNGTGFITTGKKGRPFRMRSLVDVTSVANAQTLIVSYEAAVNAASLVLIHASTNYALTPVFNKYWVLDVQSGWRAAGASVGGLNAGLFIVEANWVLIPVYVGS